MLMTEEMFQLAVLSITQDHANKVEDGFKMFIVNSGESIANIIEYGKIQRYQPTASCIMKTVFTYKDEEVFDVQTVCGGNNGFQTIRYIMPQFNRMCREDKYKEV